jgi:hypothetical protein
MKLADFYARMAPFLLGESSHQEAVAALYGSPPPTPDAERLAIYARFCRVHRHDVLEAVYSALHQTVQAQLGEDSWSQLVAAYFRAHPMHHFEMNHNAAAFPAFLQKLAADADTSSLRLPDFAAELADFEWWEWQTFAAPDDAADVPLAGGSLRFHSSVDLRPYRYDFVGWLDDNEVSARPAEPELQETMVLFWRNLSLSARRERVNSLELQLIKAVFEGLSLDEQLADRIGVPLGELAKIAWDYHRAGILLGDPHLLPPSAE